jgi:nitrate/nitrite-specific signal transduction histidine kinase
MPLGFDGPIADVEYGADEFGVWLSGYAPIRDAAGQAVAMVGVDMLADDVLKAQSDVRRASLVGFGVAYIGVFAAVYLLSGSLTKSLSAITHAARLLEQDQPFEPEQLATVARGSDEVAQLARVFSQMAVQVQAREQQLKKEVSELRIEIDQAARRPGG